MPNLLSRAMNKPVFAGPARQGEAVVDAKTDTAEWAAKVRKAAMLAAIAPGGITSRRGPTVLPEGEEECDSFGTSDLVSDPFSSPDKKHDADTASSPSPSRQVMAAARPSAEEFAAKAGSLKKVEHAERAAATAAEGVLLCFCVVV